jgi:hypothetical protein
VWWGSIVPHHAAARYVAAMDGMHSQLLQPCGADKAYLADKQGSTGALQHKMDHLVCYVPGLLALGVAHRPHAPNARRDLQTARKLMATCIEM